MNDDYKYVGRPLSDAMILIANLENRIKLLEEKEVKQVSRSKTKKV